MEIITFTLLGVLVGILIDRLIIEPHPLTAKKIRRMRMDWIQSGLSHEPTAPTFAEYLIKRMGLK